MVYEILRVTLPVLLFHQKALDFHLFRYCQLHLGVLKILLVLLGPEKYVTSVRFAYVTSVPAGLFLLVGLLSLVVLCLL
jgi:hypothetical protein